MHLIFSKTHSQYKGTLMYVAEYFSGLALQETAHEGIQVLPWLTLSLILQTALWLLNFFLLLSPGVLF